MINHCMHAIENYIDQVGIYIIFGETTYNRSSTIFSVNALRKRRKVKEEKRAAKSSDPWYFTHF